MNETICKFLEKSGYKQYTPSKAHASRFFQKQVRTENGKKFINIHEYGPVFMGQPNKYEVGMTTETNNGGIWFDCCFYGITEAQLRDHLSYLEHKLLGGVYETVGGLEQE